MRDTLPRLEIVVYGRPGEEIQKADVEDLLDDLPVSLAQSVNQVTHKEVDTAFHDQMANNGVVRCPVITFNPSATISLNTQPHRLKEFSDSVMEKTGAIAFIRSAPQ